VLCIEREDFDAAPEAVESLPHLLFRAGIVQIEEYPLLFPLYLIHLAHFPSVPLAATRRGTSSLL